MDLGLAGRSALVTGGRRGIGAAVVRSLAREGVDVAILDKVGGGEMDAVLAEAGGLGVQTLGLVGDVADFPTAEGAVREVLRARGSLDILVCSAGITRDALSWKMSEEAWDDVLRVNLKGTFACARAAASAMREADRGGRIVAISSINGLRGKVGQANYAASKAGLHGLVRTLARELGPRGITVNAVAPGMVRTPMTSILPDDVVGGARAEAPSGRLTELEEVAAAVVFLASRPAGAITGEILRVDCGQYLG